MEERLSVLTNQKAALVREREEVETTHRAEIDSLKTKESNLRKMTADINR